MLRFLPLIIEIGLVVYCLIDCAQSQDRDVRTMPRWAWFLTIILLPVIGAILWLIAGRPHRGRHGNARHSGSAGPSRRSAQGAGTVPDPRPLGPDDDPEFIERLRREQARRRQQQERRQADPESPE